MACKSATQLQIQTTELEVCNSYTRNVPASYQCKEIITFDTTKNSINLKKSNQ